MAINTKRPVVGRKYRTTTERAPVVEVGDVVECLEDDGSSLPWFRNLTRNVGLDRIAVRITSLEEYNPTENLQPGTVLVSKTDPSRDFYLVLGVYEYGGNTNVAVADLFDNSCDTESWSLAELVKGFYVKGEAPVEPEIKEVTLKEVADKMGISVDKLRIKDEK